MAAEQTPSSGIVRPIEPSAFGLAALPLRRDPEAGDFPAVGGFILAVLLILAALALAVAALRRKSGQAVSLTKPAQWLSGVKATHHTDMPQLRASLRLSPRVRLHVVEWEHEKLLVAVSDTGAASLLKSAPVSPAASSGQVAGEPQ